MKWYIAKFLSSSHQILLMFLTKIFSSSYLNISEILSQIILMFLATFL